MRWPDWLSSNPPIAQASNDSDSSSDGRPTASAYSKPNSETSWPDSLNATDWTHYTSPRTIIPSLLLTASTLFLVRLYKLHLRRIPSTSYIHPSYFRKRSLYGYVTAVGDGDNFRLFHTPGGRLAGWNWLPGRRVATQKKFKDKTIHVRLAGVDAPELAHFGRPAQPWGDEALAWLKSVILRRSVRAYIHRRDQYDRVVATVYVRGWLGKRDVGLEMLKAGLATVYEAKFGSEFGGQEEAYRNAEQVAKKAGVGMWAAAAEPGLLDRLIGRKPEPLETPRQYKDRMKAVEKK